MRFETVIFDMDGTLLDTLQDIGDSMNAVLRDYGFPQHNYEEYRYFIGDGIDMLVRRALPSKAAADEALFEEALARLREYYTKNWARKTQPYPGIEQVLTVLRQGGVKVAVLSNKPHDLTVKMAKHFFPDFDFDIVLGARKQVPKKPDPTAVLEIMQRLQSQKNQTAYVGDTLVDMKTAKAAGLFAIGAAWGFRTPDELKEHGADVIVQEPFQLLRVFGV